LQPLAALCWANKIALLNVRSYGLLGSCRLQLRGHSIVESKTEADAFDLRIAEPFAELLEYCDSPYCSLTELDTLQHGHVPYIAILLQAIRQWKHAVSIMHQI
jgi:NEDD8-activating enzyme E1 regulatory subunit